MDEVTTIRPARCCFMCLAAACTEGKTLVIIAHRPNILVNVDSILCLNDGYMEALGTRDEIISRYTLPPPPSPRPGCVVSISEKRRSA